MVKRTDRGTRPETTITLNLSKSLVDLWNSLKKKEGPLNEQLEETMVLSLVRNHKISASRGAELLGMAYEDFLSLMAENGLAFFDYEPGEVEREAALLKQKAGGKT